MDDDVRCLNLQHYFEFYCLPPSVLLYYNALGLHTYVYVLVIMQLNHILANWHILCH